MKKLKRISVLLLLSMFFLINGCSKKDKKSDTDNCNDLANAASAAVSAYIANPNEQTCNAFVSAIHNYYDGCALVDAAARQTYDSMIDASNCSGN
jgi:PBP1b-binding outer membrane lipoprotein LpoB